MNNSQSPEILAPVGDWDMCQAAVHNGADAVYLGMPYFNARGRTQDFSLAELSQMIEFCHLYGVKVFLACNVLIFERELEQIESLFRDVLALGPDALIVQDIGLVRLIKKLAPWQVVHASTQMTVTNQQAIELTNDLDITRYVLGREVSIPEMKRIREATEKELEVFVHGALCVSYSGQCLTSESHGGRSANRGQCAQSCRLSYELIVDGQVKDLGAQRYLVSPQDLCGISDVSRLKEAGINSFKIEGRLKSAEYVASTVRNYREVRNLGSSREAADKVAQRYRELSLTFARGQFNGWMDGVNHQRLVDARFSRPQGRFLGKVTAIEGEWIELSSDAPLSAGDGLVFHDFNRKREIGGLVFGIRSSRAQHSWIRFGREFDSSGIQVGMEVFHNSSSSQDKILRKSFSEKDYQKRIAVRAELHGEIGQNLRFVLCDSNQNKVTVHSEAVLEPARTAAITADSAYAELSAMSATAFELQDFQFLVRGSGFIHQRELKKLRRDACDQLAALRKSVHVSAFSESQEMKRWQTEIYHRPQRQVNHEAQLNVLIRDEKQLKALNGQGISNVFLDYEFNKDYERSLKEVRAMGFRCGIATTRILKPGELGHLKYIERLKPDTILVRNLGSIQYFQNSSIELIGDFSLNISNGLSACWFLEKGLSTLCPSYDLNQTQLIDLIKVAPASCFEVTVHQYMPAFHMEHCVFAAFLSKGTSFRDCGRPCEKHRVEMRDPAGVLHPLKPDAECRNTMFQGKPQSAARLIPDLLELGVRRFRLEALFESSAELREKIAAYLEVVTKGGAPQELFQRLGTVERYGLTEGQLFNQQVYQDKKKTSLSILPS